MRITKEVAYKIVSGLTDGSLVGSILLNLFLTIFNLF